MKRRWIFGVVLSLCLSLAACGGTTPQTPDTDTDAASAPTAVAVQDALAAVRPATHYDWADDLPRMDGSTSTIPLEAGIRAALFGISQAEAELQVKHTTTYGSFYNLINKECDLIFSVPLSDNQIQQAREKGMELEMIQIAAEGFVFVVNAQNPVDTLTQQQLKDIYSGKITNWSEVGGNDAPIVAYQRNETSGSQNFMHTFMGDTPLMDPLTSAAYTPAGMGELMDAVAVYDNAENAIGYSVYAYAADMYGSGSEIKFIHVDGVEPTKATMADGSYPLLGYNYAVYDAATPQDAPLRRLVAWLDTDEGQRAVKAAGYIPLRPVGEMAETAVRLYSAVGTGPEKPEGYVPSLYVERVDGLRTADAHGIQGLTDAALQEEINGWIWEKTQQLLTGENKADGYDVYLECVNGYLSVCLYGNNNQGYVTGVYTALYDLVAGERIAFSDLFFAGEDFVAALNADLAEQIGAQTLDWTEEAEYPTDQYPTKRPFAGLPAGHDTFTLSTVIFPAGNLYFQESQTFSFRGLYSRTVLSAPRDLTGVFAGSVAVVRDFMWEDGFDMAQPLLSNHMAVELMDESHYDPAVCRKVNETVRARCAGELSAAALTKWYHALYGGEAEQTCDILYGGISFFTSGSRYLRFSGMWKTTLPDDGVTGVPYGVEWLFDAETGEEVPYTVFLKEGWREYGRWQRVDYSGEGDALEDAVDPLPPETLTLFSMGVQEGEFVLMFGTSSPACPLVRVTVPGEYVNWDA